MSEGSAGVTVGSLLFDGASVSSDVVAACTVADLERTIEGADTLGLTLRDPHRTLLKSGLFSQRITCQVETGHAFELAQVKKQGAALSVTFEDLATAALRRRDAPRKIDANRMTRVDFARLLVSEEPWIKFEAPVAGDRTKVELARGKFGTATEREEREDTWDALGRIADEVGWRRFTRDNRVIFVPESFLYDQPHVFEISEDSPGVDSIDFDFDTGKPVAKLTVLARAARWAAGPGTAVIVKDCGPANGKWIVSTISRSLFSTAVTITLVKPRPTLPEPVPPPPTASPSASGADATAGTGQRVDTGNASAAGFAWPCRGTVTSPYGPRGGRLHAGIDIGVGVGTAVGASKAGTVTFTGEAGGYGYVVYVKHGDTTTRYAHLSRIEAKRGQQVSQGERIGLSGGAKGARGAGNSSGPHLHFEIRPGDRPADPRKYLP